MTDQTTAPANATEARATLDARMADPAWRDRFFAGDVAAKTERSALIDKIVAGERGPDVVAQIMAGKLPAGANSDQRMMAGVADMLREQGFPAKAIEETIAGKVPSPEDVERARLWKTQAIQNPEWVKRLMAGDGEARREMTAANIVLSSAPVDLS